MYTVECDGVIMFNDISLTDDVQLISPKLELSDNSAGSFTATIPPENRAYNVCKKITSTITVKKNGNWIWAGRVIKEEIDFHHRKKITAEGVLAFLNDAILPPKTYSSSTSISSLLSSILSIHNSRVPTSRRIYMGGVTVTAPNDIFDGGIETNYDNPLSFIKKYLIDDLGGHLFISYSGNQYKLNYYADAIDTSTQTIDFGINLLDFTKTFDYKDICTVCIPRGKQLDTNGDGKNVYTTIASVNSGSIYLENTTAVNLYGRFEKTIDFSDIDSPAVLKALAIEYMKIIQFETIDLNVKAVDLHMLNPEIESFEFLERVHCVSLPHGMDIYLPITKISLPLDKPENVTYTLGQETTSTLSSISSKTSASISTKLDSLPDRSSVLTEAFRNSNEILTQKTTGYVNITHTGDHSEALIISDRLPYTSSSRYWKFDMNGLGYFVKSGNSFVNQGIAITMDGRINANMITTGTLSADRIAAGSIVAAKIADGAIGTAKLAANSVTAAKLPDKVITEVKIADGAISANKIAANAVTANKILAGSISADKISSGAITTDKISSGAITSSKIASNAITADKIDARAITADKIKVGTIVADNLSGSCVTNAKIASNAVGTSEIQNRSVTDAKIDSISANKITAGTIDARNITVTNLNASNITTGSLEINQVNIRWGGRTPINGGFSFSRSIDLTSDQQSFINLSGTSSDGYLTSVTATYKIPYSMKWKNDTVTIDFQNGIGVTSSSSYGNYSSLPVVQF